MYSAKVTDLANRTIHMKSITNNVRDPHEKQNKTQAYVKIDRIIQPESYAYHKINVLFRHTGVYF